MLQAITEAFPEPRGQIHESCPQGFSGQEFGPTWLVRLLVENGGERGRPWEPREGAHSLPASRPGGPGDLLPGTARPPPNIHPHQLVSLHSENGTALLSFRKAGHVLLTPSSMGEGCRLHFRGLLSCLSCPHQIFSYSACQEWWWSQTTLSMCGILSSSLRTRAVWAPSLW